MKVMITGALGRLGQAVTRYLAEQNYQVLATDIHEERSTDIPEDVPYQACNMMDVEALKEQMTGCQAVVHLAAIPSPAQMTATETFELNVSGNFKVYEVAATLGIKRIVQASSINAWGCFWGNQEHEPQFLPVDEKHPSYTTDSYSLSKQFAEEIADYYWRRMGISSVSLRFPGVYPRDYFAGEEHRQHVEQTSAVLEDFAQLSAVDRQTRFAALKQSAANYRGALGMEYPIFKAGSAVAYSDDPLWSSYLYDRLCYYCFVTLDDVAQSIDKSLRAELEGSQALFIHNHRNVLAFNSAKLAELMYPQVSLRRPLQGDEALISLEKARSLIGFSPSEVL